MTTVWERRDDVGGDDDGVNGLVGRSGVATAALNGDAESGGRGEERSWCDVDRPNRDIGADVEAKGGGNVGVRGRRRRCRPGLRPLLLSAG